ncbi:MAG: 3-oxo-tetronate kinase [Terriglobia bacterium]
MGASLATGAKRGSALRSILLGCIADDFTGATDLANILVRGGMRTIQTIGVPGEPLPESADAVIVALKSRTIPAGDAVAQSLRALAWLRGEGCRQFLFKYCSTFDSTAAGNIGPVAEALLGALGADFTIACPASPENGRTVYHGHLFVGDALLNESGMENHPLTPMRDANIVRVLQRQTANKVGLVRHCEVSEGPGAVRQAFDRLRSNGVRVAIADAVSEADLKVLGGACADLPLITGGSGIAIGLAANFRAAGLLPQASAAAKLPRVGGHSAILSGSCSRATIAQVEHWRKARPALRIDPLALARGEPVVDTALKLAADKLQSGPVLIYATSSPEEVRAAQAQLGVAEAGRLVEQALAEAAIRLHAIGTRRFVVAGGETSGAVVQALNIRALRIGSQIDPGVPWTATVSAEPIALALKSGNFGTMDFFEKAFGVFDRLQAA